MRFIKHALSALVLGISLCAFAAEAQAPTPTNATSAPPAPVANPTAAAAVNSASPVESAIKLMAQLGLINGSTALDVQRGTSRLRTQGNTMDPLSPASLREGMPPGSDDSSSQSDPAPIVPGRFSTRISDTTGTSPAPVPGGKTYKRGLR